MTAENGQYPQLTHLLMHVSLKEVPLILEGATHSAPLAFQKALRFLIEDADKNSNFERIYAALQSKQVLNLLRQTLTQGSTGLPLTLFLKHSERLSLPQDIVTKIKELHHLCLKEQVKQAVEDDRNHMPTCVPYSHYPQLQQLLNNSSTDDIVPLLEGTIEKTAPIVFKKALGYLIENANQTSHFEKVQTALNATTIKTALLQRLDQSRQYCLGQHTHMTHYLKDDSQELRLQLFLENIDKLSIDAPTVQQMQNLVELYKKVDINTSGLPQRFYP